MNTPQIGSAEQPFPLTRPEIAVEASEAILFVLDGRQMPGFRGAPVIGATSWMSWYDPPDWRLTSVWHSRTVRPAVIHGIEGVETQILEWEAPKPQWQESQTHFARTTDEACEWLAVTLLHGGKRILRTFLDEGFDREWGAAPRRLEDTGRLVAVDDGTCTLEALPGELDQIRVGAGMFNVRVGDREFECLREIHVGASVAKGTASLERGILVESFYTRTGELVLWRRYNGRRWKQEANLPYSPHAGMRWDERFPDNARLVINGAMFVHWYDCLTDASIGIEPATST